MTTLPDQNAARRFECLFEHPAADPIKDLESGAIRHGQGVGIAKVKASFDPDRWT
jgi:hypothetical protein